MGSLVFMPQDTIDHQKNYSKISKIKREEKDLTPLSIEENLRRNQKTHIPFLFKIITKKRKFTSQFFEKKFHPKFFLSFFSTKMLQEDSTSFPIKTSNFLEFNLLASLGIANFKLDCDSSLFLFSLSLTLLSLLLKQLLLSLNL